MTDTLFVKLNYGSRSYSWVKLPSRPVTALGALLLGATLLSGCATSRPGVESGAGMTRARAAYQRHDFRTAARMLRPLAMQGDTDAQYALGYMYYYGRGVPKNRGRAISWFGEAARLGDARARRALYALTEDSRLVRHVPAGKGSPESHPQEAPAAAADKVNAQQEYQPASTPAYSVTHRGTSPDTMTQTAAPVPGSRTPEPELTTLQRPQSDSRPIDAQRAAVVPSTMSGGKESPDGKEKSQKVVLLTNARRLSSAASKYRSMSPAATSPGSGRFPATGTSNVIDLRKSRPNLKQSPQKGLIRGAASPAMEGDGASPSQDTPSYRPGNAAYLIKASGVPAYSSRPTYSSATGYPTAQQPNVVEFKPRKRSPNGHKPVTGQVPFSDSPRYTVQLLGSRRKQDLVDYVQRYDLENVRYCEGQYKGGSWYRLIYGGFNSVTEARKALKKLPKALHSKKPWIRNFPAGPGVTVKRLI